MSLEQIIALLTQYQYLLLFPLAIVEGPIVTVIAGFLAKGGIMNPLIAFPVIVIGDMVSDTFWYILGRFGTGWSFTRSLEQKAGATKENLAIAKRGFEEHRYKTTLASKLIWGLGTAGLFAAGMSRVPYLIFMTTCAIISMAQVIFFLGVGFFFGGAYEQIAAYLDTATKVTLIVGVVVAVFGVRYFLRKRRQ